MSASSRRGWRQPLAVISLSWLAACHLVLGIEPGDEIPAGDLCEDTSDCDDDNPCTADSCTSGACQNTPLAEPPAELQTDGDCKRATCDGGILGEALDDADLPNDGIECTDDICHIGEIEHPPLTAYTPCGPNGANICDGQGLCVECINDNDCPGDQNECGGSGMAGVCGCAPDLCSDFDLTCGQKADNGCGEILQCDNGMTDGDETDEDCGGDVNTCPIRCPNGATCILHTDCASGFCDGATCAPMT